MKLISPNILHARSSYTVNVFAFNLANELLFLRTINDPFSHSVIRNHDFNLPYLEIEELTSLHAHATFVVTLLYARSYNAT